MKMLSYGKRIWKTKPVLTSFKSISSEPLQKPKQEKGGKQLEQVDLAAEESLIVPKETSLIERKDYADVLNVDSFDDVPGPEFLKQISSVWKFLPAFGCQATVSVLLSFFKMAKMGSNLIGLSPRDRPFSMLFRKYGPIVKLQGPLGAEIVLISRPEHISKVYEQEGKYPIRSTLDSVDKCRSQSRKTCGGPYNLSGIEWEETRKSIEEPLMTSGERYFHPIQEAGNQFVKRIRAVLNRQNEVGDSFAAEMNKWSLECLCLITLDKSLGFLHGDGTVHASESHRLLKAVMDASNAFRKCESGFQFWRFVNTSSFLALTHACDAIDGIITKHIRYAQVNLSRKKEEITLKTKLPFIETLLVNECMNPEEVLTCILDILLIGVNTTTSALGFLLYHLAQNQRAQRTLFKEIRELLPQKDSQLEYGQIGSMPYLGACLKESLRLKMPMRILTRVLAADVVLSNFKIPKGTYMVMDAQAASLKETNFESPEKFLPERWLESSAVHPFAFIPFGHGLRSCVGKSLAETQIKSCVAKIIRNYQIEYNYGDVKTVDNVITLPSRPLKLSFIERDE